MADAADNTSTAILIAARQLFLARGYHKTSMRHIAQAAGISTGPLYFHYQSKAEIFFHICCQAHDRLLADFRQAATGGGRAGLRLRDIFLAYWGFFYAEPELFEILHLAENPMAGIDLPAQLRQKLDDLHNQSVAVMEEIIQAGVAAGELRPFAPRTLALFLHSVAAGVFQTFQRGALGPGKAGLDQMIDTAIGVIGLGMVIQPAATDDRQTTGG